MSVNIMPNLTAANTNLADLGLVDLASPNGKTPTVDANGKVVSPLNLKKINQKSHATLNEFDSELLKSLGQNEPEPDTNSDFEPFKKLDLNFLNKNHTTPTGKSTLTQSKTENISNNLKVDSKKDTVKKIENEQNNESQLRNLISPTLSEPPVNNQTVKNQVKNQSTSTLTTQPQVKTASVVSPQIKVENNSQPSPLANILNKKTEEIPSSKTKIIPETKSALSNILENKTIKAEKLTENSDITKTQTTKTQTTKTQTATTQEAPTLESLFKTKTSAQETVEPKVSTLHELAQQGRSNNLPKIDEPVLTTANYQQTQEPKAKIATKTEKLPPNIDHKAVYDLNEKLNSSVQEFNKNYAYNSYSKNYGGEPLKKSVVNHEPVKTINEPVLKETKSPEVKVQDNVLPFNRNLAVELNQKSNLDDFSFTPATGSDNFGSNSINRSQQSLIDNITNYVAQNARTNKDEIQFKIKDETGGNININIKKSKANENLNIQISVDNPEIREMLNTNNKELLTQLNNAGIKVQSFKIEGQNLFSMKNDSPDSSTSFSQSQKSSYEFQQSSNGQADRKEDSSRRQHLWNMYRERMSA